MNKDLFIKSLQDQFVEPEKLSLTFESDFKSNEQFDSLTGMAILVMINDEYSLNIPVEDFKGITTVKQLYKYIEEKNESLS